MAAGNATIAALKVSLGLDSAQFESGLRDASATMQREARKQAQAAAELERRVVSLKGALDPVYAAQKRIGGQMLEAQALYRKGALAGAEYGKIMGDLSARLKAVSSAQATAAVSSKTLQQAGLNLGRQFADVGVSLKGGISPLTVLIQQGPQIADALAVAKQQGASFGDVAKSMLGGLVKLAPAIATVGAVIAPVIVAYGLWRKVTEDQKAAQDAAKKSAEDFAQTQEGARTALGQAAEFAAKYGAENLGLSKALDAVLISQNAAYKATLDGIDANDAAGRSAAQRAELERLATVAILKRAAAEATARAVEADKDVKKIQKSANDTGFITALGLAGDPLALQAAQQAQADKFKKEGGEASKKAAADERAYAKTLNDTADALLKAKLVIPPTTKATQAHGAATHVAANQVDELDKALEDVLKRLATPAERALEQNREDMIVLKKAYDAGKISVDQYREAIDRMFPVIVEASDAQKAWNPHIEKTILDLPSLEEKVKSLSETARDLADAFGDVRFSIDDMIHAAKSGNIGALLQDVQGLGSGITALLAQGPAGVLSLGSIAANTIGGRGGRAIGGGLGIAASGLGLGAFAGSAAGAAALGTVGLGFGAISGIAALAGPIGLAAGALYAAAKLLNVGGKPTNAGAGVDLISGAITGNKRTSETEQAATGAADAIKGFEAAAKAAGIGLNTVVNGLVIGTRDASQIYLSNGQTLTSAVGDAAAAVDASARAILADATYASDQQKQLVDGLVAAGKTVDDIVAALQSYEAAQNFGQQLADRILQLTDPKAFDLKGVEDAIAAQRDAFKAAADAGYLTADQLAGLNAQLDTLRGLELDEVLKRYADALTPPPVNDNTADVLGQARDAAAAELTDAYNTFAQAKQAEIAELRQSADSLRAFRKELSVGAIAGRNPQAQLAATRAAFDALVALPAGDATRRAGLATASQDFLEALKAAAPDRLTFDRGLAAVRAAVDASAEAADAAADVAQQSLDVETASLTQLGLISKNTSDMAAALQAYLSSQALAKQAGANDNIDVSRYLADNPDLGANWLAGGSLRGLGATLDDAARAHYAMTGQYEIAAGTRRFATGGSFRVGGHGGIDSQLTKFWASPGEMVSVTHGDPMAGVAAGVVQGLERRFSLLEQAAVQGLAYQRRMDRVFRKWDGDGLPETRDVSVGA